MSVFEAVIFHKLLLCAGGMEQAVTYCTMAALIFPLLSYLVYIHSVSKETHNQFFGFPCVPGSRSSDFGRIIFDHGNLKQVTKNSIQKCQMVLPNIKMVRILIRKTPCGRLICSTLMRLPFLIQGTTLAQLDFSTNPNKLIFGAQNMNTLKKNGI